MNTKEEGKKYLKDDPRIDTVGRSPVSKPQ
jgi:hypothetical protein